MANADRPNGAKPSGDPIRIGKYTAGAAVYPGDFVIMSDDGKVDPVATGGSSYTSACCGVAATKAADGEEVLVYDDPNQRFSIQADGSDVDAQTDIHLNYAILGTSPDTTYNVSRMELDSNTGATTATLPLKLLKIKDAVGNALGAQVECEVVINNHQLKGGTGTAGV